MARDRRPRSWIAVWPFAALCLLAGSRWLQEGALPATQSTAGSEAAGCIMAAGLVGFSGALRSTGAQARQSRLPFWRTVGAAAVVLTAPAVAAAVSSRHVSGNDATLALALTPVVVAVASAANGTAETGGLAGRLWPGLAGMAGLLLLIPPPDFSGWRFVAALGALPLLSGCAAAGVQRGLEEAPGDTSPSRGRLARKLSGSLPRNPLGWEFFALLAAAAVFALLGPRTHWGQPQGGSSFPAAGLDGLTFLLSLLVLRRLGAIGWAAQFLAIPLLTLLEGAGVLRPVLDLRSWIGFALLAVSSGYLLLPGSADQDWTAGLSGAPGGAAGPVNGRETRAKADAP